VRESEVSMLLDEGFSRS